MGVGSFALRSHIIIRYATLFTSLSLDISHFQVREPRNTIIMEIPAKSVDTIADYLVCSASLENVQVHLY